MKLNKSFIYFFPRLYQDIINNSNLQYKLFFENTIKHLHNTYCFNEYREEFILIIKDRPETDLFLDQLELYKDLIRIDTKGNYTIYIFNINNDCKDCYEMLLSGKYSKISDIDKRIILTFVNRLFKDIVGGKDKINQIAQILNKSPNMINKIQSKLGLSYFEDDWELSSKINIENENFNINNLE